MEYPDFKNARNVAQRNMSIVRRVVEEVLSNKPALRNLGNDDNGSPYINRLVRYIWNNYKDYNVRSIIRFYTEIIKDHPEWDTKHNQLHRANAQTAFHEYFR